MVWQTRVTTAAGKLVAIVTQTQLVLSASGSSQPPAGEASAEKPWESMS
jgi:hypothetical protein